jgi:hypothetical protein
MLGVALALAGTRNQQIGGNNISLRNQYTSEYKTINIFTRHVCISKVAHFYQTEEYTLFRDKLSLSRELVCDLISCC